MSSSGPTVVEVDLEEVEVMADGLQYAEGPVVLADGSVAVTEIRAGLVTRCHADGSRTTIADVGDGPNGAALGPDGYLYVCNNGGHPVDRARIGSIQRVEIASGAVECLYVEAGGQPLVSPNDIVFDETGMFWFTDYGGGAICYASPAGDRIERVIDGVLHPNGIGLSPDGTTLYWAQSMTRQVMRRRLADHGRLVPSPGYTVSALIRHGTIDPDAVVVGLPGSQELDSLAVEADGKICVATLVESGITVVDPDGTVVEKHVLPKALDDRTVTNICFGGSDMRTAYITLLLSGRLIKCRWPRPGLRLAFQPEPDGVR